jgi:hypothetical protein
MLRPERRGKMLPPQLTRVPVSDSISVHGPGGPFEAAIEVPGDKSLSHRALILGAMALLAMRDRFGFRSFMTGVQPGNAPSEAVCRATGLSARGRQILTIADPSQLVGGKMTR